MLALSAILHCGIGDDVVDSGYYRESLPLMGQAIESR
jgi:hypothetical protein